MKKLMFRPVALLSLGFLASCGGGGGGSGDGLPDYTDGVQDSAVSVRSREDYLNSLESWKRKPVKACSLYSAFSIKAPFEDDHNPGLDLKQVLASNKNSAIFTKGRESILLTEYASMSGYAISSTTGTEFDAEVERSGSHCTVKIDGKEVFSTEIVESVTIGNRWEEKETIGATDFDLALQSTFKPSHESIGQLGGMMKLETWDAIKYIKIKNTTPEFLYRVSETQPWNSIYMHENGRHALEVRFPVPKLYSKGEVLNTKDSGNLVFKLKYKLGTIAEINSMEFLGTRAHNAEEASRCLMLMDLTQVPYETLFKRCSILDPQIRTHALENGTMEDLTVKYFSLNLREQRSNFPFKDSLKELVERKFLAGEDVRSIDPEQKVERIQKVAKNMAAISNATNLSPKLKELEEELFEIGFEWAFRDPASLEPEFESLINVALEFIDPFSESTASIIEGLAQNTEDYYALRALKFAHDLANKDQYKAKALQAMKLAEARRTDRVANQIYRIFQARITHETLDQWITIYSR